VLLSKGYGFCHYWLLCTAVALSISAGEYQASVCCGESLHEEVDPQPISRLTLITIVVLPLQEQREYFTSRIVMVRLAIMPLLLALTGSLPAASGFLGGFVQSSFLL